MSVKPVIVYIEGLDRCGKTTLATQLSKDTGLQIAHFGVPPELNTYSWYLDKYLEMVVRHAHGFILDRFIMSNRVYAGRFGGGVLSDEEYYKLAKILWSSNPLLILMSADYDKIRKRIEVDSNSAGKLSLQEIRSMSRLFRSYFEGADTDAKLATELPEMFDFSMKNLGKPLTPTDQYYTHYGRVAQQLMNNGGLRYAGF